MNRTLHLEVSEDIYASLVEAAEKAGQQPEAVAVQMLTDAFNNHKSDDPFAPFIGAIATDKWADRHDELFGRHIVEEMTAKDVDDTD
jgi:hypothetical protein